MGNDDVVGVGGDIGEECGDQDQSGKAPMIWAVMNPGAELGALPAKVSENILPIVTAGFANEVEQVNQYAAPM